MHRGLFGGIGSLRTLREVRHGWGFALHRPGNEAGAAAAAVAAASTPDPRDDYAAGLTAENKWDAEREKAEARKKALKGAAAGGEGGGAGADDDAEDAAADAAADGGETFARTLDEAARGLARPINNMAVVCARYL